MSTSKYQPLETHLRLAGNRNVPMTFKEIEEVIGTDLPRSARKYRPWWSNNPSNSSITHFWLAAGYKTTEVDLGKERLVFVRDKQADVRSAPGRDPTSLPSEHPVLGCMVDTVTVADGVDLTKPAMSEWSRLTQASEIVHD